MAYLHALHMEGGQMRRELTFDQRHPFGVRGKDFSRSYPVTTIPLYANLPREPAMPETDEELFDVVAVDTTTHMPRLIADRKAKGRPNRWLAIRGQQLRSSSARVWRTCSMVPPRPIQGGLAAEASRRPAQVIFDPQADLRGMARIAAARQAVGAP